MNFLRYILLAGFVAFAAPSQAVEIVWPRDNGIIRETVNVAVDAASVPDGAHIIFFLNDTFIQAVGNTTPISGGRQAFTWIWDTREPINLGQPHDPPVRPEDGQYEIRAQAVDGTGQVVGIATANVQLANRVTSISPETPLELKYNYRPGMEKRYQVRVSVTVAEMGGAPITSTQEVQAFTYTGVMSVEDMRDDGLALLRYKPAPENRLLRFGRFLGPLPGFDAGSVYQLVDNRGRVHETDLFSTAGIRTHRSLAVDVRTPLPRGQVRMGDQWTGPIGISLPALGESFRTDGQLQFEGLEWAAGRECARIKTEFSGPATITLAIDQPGQTGGMMMGMGMGMGGQQVGGMATLRGTGTDWFAFRTGELIRRDVTINADTILDTASVQTLNEGLGMSGITYEQPMAASPYERADDRYRQPGDEEFEIIEDYQRGIRDAFRTGIRGPATPEGTRVKLRIRVSARLLN